MSSVEENLFFRSMKPSDVDTFVDKLKKKNPSFSNCPAVDQKNFNAHYQETYGRSGCVVWLGRKTSHLILIFWDGIIKNVVNIFEIFIKSVFLLARRIYHSRCFTKTLSNESSLYISEKINSLSVKVYNIRQNFVVAFGHGYSLINDKEGRFTIDRTSLEKHGYSYRYLHEEAAVTGNFDNEKLELAIHGKFFDNWLNIDGFSQDKIDTLAATLIKLHKFDKSYDHYEGVLASVIMLEGFNKNFGIQELQKRLEIVEILCNKLPDDMADKFISTVTERVINYCFDSITQTLNEENKYQVLETILPFINKIKDLTSFYFVSKNIFGAFLGGGSYYCSDFRKNLLLNNEKELLKVFVNTNPKTFMGVLLANQSKNNFTLQQGILEAQAEGADWSERQIFLRETVKKLRENNPTIFLDYLAHINNYHYYILRCLFKGGHDYLKENTQEYEYASRLILHICEQKKENVKLFLETFINKAKEKSLKIGELNFVEFATALSSENAMKIWDTLIANREFIMKAIEEDRMLLLSSAVADSEEYNKRILTLLCCFKHTPTLTNQIPKPLRLIIAGKALEIYSPVF